MLVTNDNLSQNGCVNYEQLMGQFQRSKERASGRKKSVPRVLKVPANAVDSIISGNMVKRVIC